MVMMTKWRIEPHFVAVSSLSSAPQTHKGLLLLTRSVMPRILSSRCEFGLNGKVGEEEVIELIIKLRWRGE